MISNIAEEINDSDINSGIAFNDENDPESKDRKKLRELNSTLQELKAKAMDKMVEDLTIRDTRKKFLFLTNSQARMFNESNIHTLIEAFNLPKPQLVIKLMNSSHGCAYERSKRDARGGRPVELSSLYNVKNSVEAESELTLFLQEFLIPLAAANHAILFVRLIPECTLFNCLKSALAGIRSRYGRRLPFTVIGIDTELYFHNSLEDEKTYTNDIKDKSVNWREHCEHMEDLHAEDNIKDAMGDAEIPEDIDNIILVDGIDDDGKVDTMAARELEWLVLRQFSKTLPCIGLQTDRCESAALKLLQCGVPVVYLDSRPREGFEDYGDHQEERVKEAMWRFKRRIEQIVRGEIVEDERTEEEKREEARTKSLDDGSNINSRKVVPETVPPVVSSRFSSKLELFDSCSISYFHNVLYGDGNYGSGPMDKGQDKGVFSYQTFSNWIHGMGKKHKKSAFSLSTAIEQSNDGVSDSITESQQHPHLKDEYRPAGPSPQDLKAVASLITESELLYKICLRYEERNVTELVDKFKQGKLYSKLRTIQSDRKSIMRFLTNPGLIYYRACDRNRDIMIERDKDSRSSNGRTDDDNFRDMRITLEKLRQIRDKAILWKAIRCITNTTVIGRLCKGGEYEGTGERFEHVKLKDLVDTIKNGDLLRALRKGEAERKNIMHFLTDEKLIIKICQSKYQDCSRGQNEERVDVGTSLVSIRDSKNDDTTVTQEEKLDQNLLEDNSKDKLHTVSSATPVCFPPDGEKGDLNMSHEETLIEKVTDENSGDNVKIDSVSTAAPVVNESAIQEDKHIKNVTTDNGSGNDKKNGVHVRTAAPDYSTVSDEKDFYEKMTEEDFAKLFKEEKLFIKLTNDYNTEDIKMAVSAITDATLINRICKGQVDSSVGDEKRLDCDELIRDFRAGKLFERLQNTEDEREAQERRREIYTTLTHPKFSHGHILQNRRHLERTMEHLLLSNRLPKKNPFGGLLLIREAWDSVDICNHIARRYKFLAKVLYLVFLLLMILLTVLTALENKDFFLTCQECEITSGVTMNQFTVYVLSVLSSIVSSIMAFVSPVHRWRALRGTAHRLESAIWQYRTRVGVFEVREAGSRCTPEVELRMFIKQIKEGLHDAGGLGTTSFGSKYADSVYTHGQYDDIFDKRGFIEKRNLPSALRRQSVGLMQWLTCCMTQSEANVEHEDDDHYSPQTPESYINLRAEVMKAFYQSRLPPNFRFYTTVQVLLILASALSAAVTFFSLTEYVAVIAIVSTSISAYVEFHSTDQKLSRYNSTIAALQNVLVWWSSLTKVEKADTRNISRLVMSCEQIHTGELEAWLSKPQKSLSDVKEEFSIGGSNKEESVGVDAMGGDKYD